MTLKTMVENRLELTDEELGALEYALTILGDIIDKENLENFTLVDKDGAEYNEEYANRAYDELTNFLENTKEWT